MAVIVKKEKLNEKTYLFEISAPLIAKKARPGQFILVKADEKGERIPFTIADSDAKNGTVSIIFQTVGRSTSKLSTIGEGGEILNVLGPLGEAARLDGSKKAAVIGGGLGAAIAYPYAKFLYENGVHVDAIVGFRSKELIILANEMKAHSSDIFITTDDGSNGRKGFVTDVLRENIENGAAYDLVISIGPVIMMKNVSLMTKKYGIKTIVSLNPIMIDGTGMCGGCRVNVGGEIKFACADGPDFDGHLVDFDGLTVRNRVYDKNHKCRMEFN